MKAIRDHVIVRPNPPSVVSDKIVLPDMAISRPQEGEVISVGPRVEDPAITEGCHVLFHELAAVEAEDRSECPVPETVLVLCAGDVMAVRE